MNEQNENREFQKMVMIIKKLRVSMRLRIESNRLYRDFCDLNWQESNETDVQREKKKHFLVHTGNLRHLTMRIWLNSELIWAGYSSRMIREVWQLRSHCCFHSDVLKNGRFSGDFDDQICKK